MRSQLFGLEELGYNQAIEQAKRNLKLQIQNYEFQFRQRSSIDETSRDLLMRVARDENFWQQLEPEQKRRFYRALVDRIVLRDGKIELVALKV